LKAKEEFLIQQINAICAPLTKKITAPMVRAKPLKEGSKVKTNTNLQARQKTSSAWSNRTKVKIISLGPNPVFQHKEKISENPENHDNFIGTKTKTFVI